MAEIKTKYYSTVALTFTTLGALAASATWVAGAESLAVDNTSNLYDDYLISMILKTAATNYNTVACKAELWIVAPLNDTPLWPGVFAGTDATRSPSRDELYNVARYAGVINLSGTTAASTLYAMAPVSVAQLYGGIVPVKFSAYVTHNLMTSTNVLAAQAAGINQVYVTPATYTSA